ncbi:MAG: FG-GAP-like repeat-containing protein, partial [bacterium]|nr:FG-GAP-like repeat-containing protein [bacterium]
MFATRSEYLRGFIFQAVLLLGAVLSAVFGPSHEAVVQAEGIYNLADANTYDTRLDGTTAITELSSSLVADVNGDSVNDIIFVAPKAIFNGTNSGSVLIRFGGGAAASGNINLADPTNYNLRIDGVPEAALTYIRAGDVNGDGLGDLIIAAPDADYGNTDAGSIWVLFSTLIDDVGSSTGNIWRLSESSTYNIRYDGENSSDMLAYEDTLSIGDINGDGFSDLVFGTSKANYGGGDSGSVWIIFSSLIDDIGLSTGNVLPLSSGSSFNIRYDGEVGFQRLTAYAALLTGDLNGDGFADLIFGTYSASYNFSSSGSVWICFSTLIDDVAETQGNIRSVANAADYNLRFDGAVNVDNLTHGGSLAVGDVNSDGVADLLMGTYTADNNGANSGSIWVVFSTLIDDVGSSTGNNWALSVAGNYNIRYDGSAANQNLGSSGAISVGDVNGDGNSDLVIGAERADISAADSGSAWVMFSTLIDDVGSSTGNNKSLSVAGNYNIRYDGAALSNNLTRGRSLKIADVNGDNLSDLMLGAYLADIAATDSGSLWVMFSTLIDDVGASTGNNKPLSTATNYNIRYDGVAGEQISDRSAIFAGDLDGDGLSDLQVGSWAADGNGLDAGSVWVMSSTLVDDVAATTGNVKSLSSLANYSSRYDGDNRLPGLGDRVVTGDINGDGIDDLIIGAPNASFSGGGSGSVYVYFGRNGFSLPSSALVDSVDFNIRYDGAAASDWLGTDLAVGDVNGDGVADLLMSANGASFNGSGSGSVYVVFSTKVDDFGSTSSNIVSLLNGANFNLRYDGYDNFDWLGDIYIADVNGDGLSDLLLRENFNGSQGGVWVIFSTLLDDVGLTTGNVKPISVGANYNIRYQAAGFNHRLGLAGSVVTGDVNGDGFGDLILGAEEAGYAGVQAGAAYVFFSTLIDDVGASTGNNFSLATASVYNIRFDATAVNDFLTDGGNMAAADLNGDGVEDLVLGATEADLNGLSSGSVWGIFSTLLDDYGVSTGNNLSLAGAANYNLRIDGAVAGDGLAYLGHGDVNDDGFPDLAVGTGNSDNNGAGSGSVWLLFSSYFTDLGTTTGNIAQLNNPSSYNVRLDGAAGDYLTIWDLLNIADVNADSKSDLVVGSSIADNNGVDSGSVWVVYSTLLDDFGATTGNNLQFSNPADYSLRFDGPAADSWLGSSGIITGGDLDNDGVDDLLISTSASDINGLDSGSIYLINGDPFVYTISGNIDDGVNPLSGVTVDGGALGTAVTDIGGNYSFSNVAKLSSYTLTPSKTGYSFAPTSISAVALADTTHDFVATLNTYTISGAISVSGNPLSGVSVDGGALGIVNSAGDGSYSFINVPYGTSYTLTPSKAGYSFTPAPITAVASTNATHNFLGQSLASTISGVVAQNGVPVSGATVTLQTSGGEVTTTTSANGAYSFANVPAGSGNITVEKGGQIISTEVVNVVPGENLEPQVEITDAVLAPTLYSFWNGFLGMVNVLELVNPGNGTLLVDISLRDIDGVVVATEQVRIPAGGERDVIVNDLPGFSTNSYGLLTVDAGNAEVDGRMTYYRLDGDTWGDEFDFVYSLELMPAITGETTCAWNTYAPAGVVAGRAEPSITPNWLSIANLDSSTRNFTITYRDQTGDIITTATLVIPSFGKRDIQAGHEFSTSGAVGLISITPESNSVPYIATVSR